MAALQIGVKLVLLEMLKQGTAGAVDDAFWDASGAGGIEDVKRVIAWQLSERDVLAPITCNKGGKVGGLRYWLDVWAIPRIRYDDGNPQRGKFLSVLSEARQCVDNFAV